MRVGRLSRPELAVALAMLAICGAQARPQDRPKIEIVLKIPHSGWVVSVALSPDRARVLSGSGDKTIKLWDAATGALLCTFEGHPNWVSSVAFSADGDRVLSGSDDYTIELWDAIRGGHNRKDSSCTHGD